jgi:glycosyltransferase involved in cell wall biosynthesis
MVEGEGQGRLSVLIPIYNEADLVGDVIHRVFALGELIHEVIAINDGSTDGTREALDRLGDFNGRLRVFHLPRNQGKTAAIQRGLLEATGDCLIIQDADLEYDPAEIPEVVGPILVGEADVVYGSRFLVRRAARVLYFYHYLANKLLTLMSNLLTNRNMTDIETGYKAFRREVIQPLRLTSRGFGMEVEITAMICQTRARTYEVPISYHGRTYEEGKKIGFRDGVAAIWYILYYNLVQPHLREGRDYIRAVNEFLSSNSRI